MFYIFLDSIQSEMTVSIFPEFLFYHYDVICKINIFTEELSMSVDIHQCIAILTEDIMSRNDASTKIITVGHPHMSHT